MQIETQRLILRDWRPHEDARHAMDIFGDRRVMAWVDHSSQDMSIRQVQGRLQRYKDFANKEFSGEGSAGHSSQTARSWAVEQKDIGRVIGHVMLTPLPDIKKVHSEPDPEGASSLDPEGMSTDYVEINWHFRPASWGYGYATEAAFCVCQHAFEVLALPLLLAIDAPENLRSAGVTKRIGMRCDGVTTRDYRGEERLLYRLSAEAFREVQERQKTEKEFLAALNKLEQQV